MRMVNSLMGNNLLGLNYKCRDFIEIMASGRSNKCKRIVFLKSFADFCSEKYEFNFLDADDADVAVLLI